MARRPPRGDVGAVAVGPSLLSRLAAARQEARAGRGCGTCRPPHAETVRHLMDGALKEGRRYAVADFHAVLVADGYSLSKAALQKHMTECERDLWRALKAASVIRA